jgi:hypothetical protein
MVCNFEIEANTIDAIQVVEMSATNIAHIRSDDDLADNNRTGVIDRPVS